MFRGVFAWLVIWPNAVGLVRLRLGLLGWKWFRMLVNVNEQLRAHALLVDAEILDDVRIQVPGGQARGGCSSRRNWCRNPRTQGRNSPYTAPGLVNTLQAVGAAVLAADVVWVPLPDVGTGIARVRCSCAVSTAGVGHDSRRRVRDVELTALVPGVVTSPNASQPVQLPSL